MAWHEDIVLCETERYGTVRYSVVKYGLVWYGTVRYGTVRCGFIWYAMVWYDMTVPCHTISYAKTYATLVHYSDLA